MQVSLSRMWGAGDLLLVYRPYLRANAEEETIFGAHRPGALSNPAHTMAYDVVQRADPSLYEQLPPPSPSAALSFANYHLLYGSVTVISKIEFPGAGGGGGAGQGITLRSSSITPRLTQQPQHSPHSRLLCPVLGRLIGVFLCKRNYNNGCSNGIIGVNGRASDGDPVVELWVQALGSAGRESVGTGSEGRNAPKSPTVLRVRYLANMYPAMRSMTGFPGFQNEGSCVVGSNTAEQPADDVTERLRCLPTAQAGQLVSISGLRALHLSTLHLHPALQQQQWNEQRPPPPSVAGYLLSAYPQLLHCALEVLNCGFSDIGGNIVDPAATSCLFEPNAAVYMHATAASLPTMDDSREGGLADPSVLALCSLPALACSPSLQLPIPLQQALALAHTPTSGAILVHASIQPLHPSVRLCCPPGLEGARSSSNSSISTSGSHPVADPRTAQAPEAAAVDDASTAVVLGYQLVCTHVLYDMM